MKMEHAYAHQGDMGDSERVRMTFDENAIAHLMSVLTDLYSNKRLAVIREYATNAWDSHVRAGVTKPIRVYLPSALDPHYRVVDEGEGLCETEVKEQVSKYGFSANRESNATGGMFGLGFKAGLSYTTQFTVTAVKDGIRTMVLVTRDTDGCGAMEVISSEPTDQQNGVEVSIPIKGDDQAGFRKEARNFFRFWDPGSVLIDDEVPECIWAGDLLEEDVAIIGDRRRGYGTDPGSHYVVMGNVPYKVGMEMLASDHWYAFRVPIGSVVPVPSREALQDSKGTEAALAAINDYISTRVLREYQKRIDAASSIQQACAIAHQVYHKSTTVLGGALTYRGLPIPRKITPRTVVKAYRQRKKLDEKNVQMTEVVNFPDGSRKTILLTEDDPRSPIYEDVVFHIGQLSGYTDETEYYFSRSAQEDIDRFASAFHIYGYGGKVGLDPVTVRRIGHYLAQRGLKPKWVLVYKHYMSEPWIKTDMLIHFDEIKKVQLPPEVGVTVSNIPVEETGGRWKYRVAAYTRSGQPARAYMKSYHKLPGAVEAWCEYEKFSRAAARADLAGELDGKVALVHKAEINRFQRDHPEIPHLKDHLTALLDKEMAKYGLYHNIFAGFSRVDRNVVEWVRYLPYDARVMDHDILEAKRCVMEALGQGGANNKHRLLNLKRLLANHFGTEASTLIPWLPEMFKVLRNRYPLAERALYREAGNEPLIRYLNATYMAEVLDVFTHPRTYL